MNEFKEKLKTLNISLRRASSEKKPVINQETGRLGGYQTTHWDDHQDAEVIVEPVQGSFGEDED